MSKETVIALVVGVALVAAIVALGVGAFATTSQTESISGPVVEVPSPPLDGSGGIVFSKWVNGGTNIFGIQFSSPSYRVDVQMVVPTECIDRDEQGDETLVDGGRCEDLPATGELVGSGFTDAGRRLAFVRTEVSHTCYDALEIGDGWPSQAEECESDAD